MPNISMIDIDALLDSELAGFVKKALRHRAPDPAFHAIQGHNPALSKALYIAWGTVLTPVRLTTASRRLFAFSCRGPRRATTEAT